MGSNGHLHAPPTLDAIADDPATASGLSRETLVVLALKCAAVQAAVAAELMRVSADASPIDRDRPAADCLLTGKQVAEHLEVKESWVMTEARAGRIPKCLVGRYVRFDLVAVERALRERAEA